MIKHVIIAGLILFGSLVFAGTSAHFTMGGDRVLINLQAGIPGSPDDDTIRLFEGMNVSTGSTFIGKRQTKQIKWKSAMTMALSKNKNERVDGTIMIYRWPGVRIDTSRRTVTIKWSGSAAEALSRKFKAVDGTYEFHSGDHRLQIKSTTSDFYLFYSDY